MYDDSVDKFRPNLRRVAFCTGENLHVHTLLSQGRNHLQPRFSLSAERGAKGMDDRKNPEGLHGRARARPTQDVVVSGNPPLAHFRPGVLLNLLPSTSGDPRGQSRIIEKPHRCVGHGRRILRVDEQPRFAAAEHRRDIAGGSGEDGQARGKGFENRDRLVIHDR